MLPIYVGVIIINHFKDAHSITSIIMESRRFFFPWLMCENAFQVYQKK